MKEGRSQKDCAGVQECRAQCLGTGNSLKSHSMLDCGWGAEAETYITQTHYLCGKPVAQMARWERWQSLLSEMKYTLNLFLNLSHTHEICGHSCWGGGNELVAETHSRVGGTVLHALYNVLYSSSNFFQQILDPGGGGLPPYGDT